MPQQRWYKPLDIKNQVTADRFTELGKQLSEICEEVQLRSHQYLLLQNFALVNSTLLSYTADVQVKVPDTPKTNNIEDLPDELKETLRKLKEEYELTDKELLELIKLTNLKKFKKLELKKQIEEIEKRANIIRNRRNQDKIHNKLKSNYEKFYECLQVDLKFLDPDIKKDIKELLSNASKAIEDIQNEL